MDEVETKLIQNMAAQVNQLHAVVLGVEGQGGLLRQMKEIGDRMDAHQKTDTDFQTRMEVKFGKERIATMKLIGASTAMGGIAGTITHKLSGVMEWFK